MKEEGTTSGNLPVDSQTQAYKIMEHQLGEQGMSLLTTQLDNLQRLNGERLHSPLRESLRSGNTNLPQGTLVHSTRMHTLFDEGLLDSISKNGILSGELVGVVEDAETHGCADFFKVPQDMTVEEYVDFAKQPIQIGQVRTSRGERMLTSGVSFLVDPKTEGVDVLTANDGYTNPDMNSFIRPPGNRTSEYTSAILGGMPRDSIAGILIGGEIAADEEKRTALAQMFPDVPVLSHAGEVLG